MMNERELLRLCRVWQKRLLLQDWTITSVTYDDTLPEWGEIVYNDLSDVAAVKIHPLGPEGPEFYLVHELLHIRLRKVHGIEDDEENVINMLSRAFLKVYPKRKLKVANPTAV